MRPRGSKRSSSWRCGSRLGCSGTRTLGRAGELAALRLRDEEQRPILDSYLDALERGDVPAPRPAWARPGWLPEVREWIEQEAARLGLTVVGVEQVKHWSISSVLRIDDRRTRPLLQGADAAAALRRRGEGDRQIGGAVSRPRPGAAERRAGARLAATRSVRRAVHVWRRPSRSAWSLLRRFARLQRRTSELADELLADGCLDRRLDVLETQIDPLVERCRGGRTPHPRGGDRAEAVSLRS